MIGVAAPGPGIFATQTADSLDHVSGNPFSSEEPLKCGPRHCAQLSPSAEQQRANEEIAEKNRASFMAFGFSSFRADVNDEIVAP
jgi:hypothetical protein